MHQAGMSACAMHSHAVWGIQETRVRTVCDDHALSPHDMHPQPAGWSCTVAGLSVVLLHCADLNTWPVTYAICRCAQHLLNIDALFKNEKHMRNETVATHNFQRGIVFSPDDMRSKLARLGLVARMPDESVVKQLLFAERLVGLGGVIISRPRSTWWERALAALRPILTSWLAGWGWYGATQNRAQWRSPCDSAQPAA
eukprot:242415-Chlamydomonas_euryale.AAC.3